MNISLEGLYHYKTDYDDLGLKEKWYKSLDYEGNITLPGSTVEDKIGTKLNESLKLSKDSVQNLRAKYSYIGPIWYSKKVFIPYEYKKKEIILFLERVMMHSMVWINSNFAGQFASFSVPHKFNITKLIKYGCENTITIRVDNRDIYKIMNYSSSYTEETQTIWNGIVGEMSLQIKNKVNIEKINVFPKLDTNEIEVEILTNNNTCKNDYNVKITVDGFDEEQSNAVILDCCIYPLTGYPPTDVKSYEKIFNTLKEYGLNHVRFHSWCPPESAFLAADKCGIYIQAEGPIWLDDYFCEIGSYAEHYDFFPKEAKRIIDNYNNHPSFMIFSNGNEIRGDFSLLKYIISNVNKDKRVLYTLTTNWDREVCDLDDVLIAQSFDNIGVRGQYFLDDMVNRCDLNFDKAVSKRNLPIISHEVGQYSVYPDVRDIYKFTGNLRPINFESIKHDLENKDMISYIDKFVYASGSLAANLYKDDIESSLKTKELSGVQLLGLSDFTGQGTATVGLLNVFLENKHIIDASTFRNFFGPVVILINTEKRIYSTLEDLKFKILISNYSNVALIDKTIDYKIYDNREVLFSGNILTKNIDKNTLVELEDIIDIPLNTINKNTSLKLEIEIKDTTYKNSWNLWIYKDKINNTKKIIQSKKEFIDCINNEEDCIVYLNSRNSKGLRKNKYFPCFWSPVHFETRDPNGLFIDNSSDLFNDFPTSNYGDYEWKSIVEDSEIINVDNIYKNIDNIAQIVPNFFHNERSSIIFTAKIKNSRVVFTTINFDDISNKPIEVQALYSSIVNNISKIKVKSSMELYTAAKLFK